MKKLSIISLIMALALVFTGCTNAELKLYNASLKAMDMTAMESVTDLSFKLEGEGLSEENQLILEGLMQMLNSTKITVSQKTNQSADKTKAKTQMDMQLDFGGVKTDMNVWVDVDMSEDKLELVEIIKMPQMLMGALGEEYANKEYIEYDFDQVFAMAGNQVDMKELMDWSKDMQPRTIEFMKDYASNFDLKLDMVKYKGSKTVNNELADLYELKLNDKAFKKLVRYLVNDWMENEDIKEFMNGYMEMVFSIANVSETEESKAKLELENMEKSLPELKDKFNTFMDEFDKIQVLDGEGILIEYAINKDGYIISEKGSINLKIDLAEISKSNPDAGQMKGLVKFQINFDTSISNINELIKIEMPELTDENSMKISELMNLGM